MLRRDLIRLGGMALVTHPMALLTGCGESVPPDPFARPGDPAASAALRAMMQSLDGIAYFGPVCRASEGGSRSLAQLEDLLQGRSEDSLIAALQNLMAEDFSGGRTAEIDGWVMSRTECLIAAAAAKAQGLREASEATPDTYAEAVIAAVIDWGPQSTFTGVLFNPVGNGRGGFWVRIEDSVPGSVRLALGAKEIVTHFQPGVVTGSLEPEFMDQVLSQPAAYPLQLRDRARRLQQTLGDFVVTAPPAMALLPDGTHSSVFCEIGAWGPQAVAQGAAFNEQADGSAAIWVAIGCMAPVDVQLLLAGEALPTDRHLELVTARVPHYASLARGTHELWLVDERSGERLQVGLLQVQ